MSNLSDFSKAGLTFQGVYGPAVTYKRNNVVTYESKTYVCIVASSVGSTPGVGGDWGVLAESATISTTTTGAGTNPANFVLEASGGSITLNRGA
jgi:hypothetical protein